MRGTPGSLSGFARGGEAWFPRCLGFRLRGKSLRSPYTLHPIPSISHPTPYTLHPTPGSSGAWVSGFGVRVRGHPPPYTQTFHLTPSTLHPPPSTLPQARAMPGLGSSGAWGAGASMPQRSCGHVTGAYGSCPVERPYSGGDAIGQCNYGLVEG